MALSEGGPPQPEPLPAGEGALGAVVELLGGAAGREHLAVVRLPQPRTLDGCSGFVNIIV